MKTYDLTMIFSSSNELKLESLNREEMMNALGARNPSAFIFDVYEDGEYSYSADWNLKKDMTIRNLSKRYESIKKRMEKLV